MAAIATRRRRISTGGSPSVDWPSASARVESHRRLLRLVRARRHPAERAVRSRLHGRRAPESALTSTMSAATRRGAARRSPRAQVDDVVEQRHPAHERADRAPPARRPLPRRAAPRSTSCATSGGTLRGSKPLPPRRARRGARWRLSHCGGGVVAKNPGGQGSARIGSAVPSTRSRSDSRRPGGRGPPRARADSDMPSATSSDASRREPEPSSCSRRAASSAPPAPARRSAGPGHVTRATESAPRRS